MKLTLHILPGRQASVFFLIAVYSLLFLGRTDTSAQDVHFSQYLNAPLLLNPSLTGNSSYRVRAGLNYRNQWASVTKPFITQDAFGDVKLTPKKLKNDWIGVGALVYNDKAGDGNLKTTKGFLFGSYNKSFNRINTFYGGIGLSLGFANRSIEYDKLYFESQWIGYRFDTQKETNELLSDDSFFYFDMNAGLFVKYIEPKKYEFHLGASFNHVNRPHEKFYIYDQRMGFKTILHGGISILLNEEIFIKPDIMYTFVNTSDELLVGGMVGYKVDESYFYLGCWTRTGRDVIPVAGFFYQGFRIMASYDYNVSKLHYASQHKGGFEISLTKSIRMLENTFGSKFKSASSVPKFSSY
ncbi:MAG: PorP/SprF family type IX secretion system membrane protein [Bacteroidetes bacterium]|nr:PorP/SprF family type IX secretion system membrane protein [Bacteroidota bacterium]